MLSVGVLVKVVPRKVTPAVPLVTLLPPVTLSVDAPMLKVPRVNVSPAPAAVRSEVMVNWR